MALTKASFGSLYVPLHCRAHAPPQSTPVSSPFCLVSKQLGFDESKYAESKINGNENIKKYEKKITICLCVLQVLIRKNSIAQKTYYSILKML
jgi:hypothetical protein